MVPPTPPKKRGRKPKEGGNAPAKQAKTRLSKRRSKAPKGKKQPRKQTRAKGAKAAKVPRSAKPKPAPKSGSRRKPKTPEQPKSLKQDSNKGRKRQQKHDLSEEQIAKRALASRKSSAYHRVRKQCLKDGMDEETAKCEARKASMFAV